MSNGRRFRRQQTPPAHIRAALAGQECPDCNSKITTRWRGGAWQSDIAHDDGCIQLAWRQRHGATRSVAIVPEPGRTLSADLVAEVAGIVAEQPGVVGLRVSGRVALSRSERERIDEVLS